MGSESDTVRALAVVLGAVIAVAPARAAPADPVAAFALEVQGIAGAPWRVSHAQSTITLSRELVGDVPGAPAGGSAETGRYTIVLTIEPYVDAAAQRKRLTAAQKREAALRRDVARFTCREKSFADHYVDGLCFHTTREQDERRVLAYRKARDVLSNVPRYHRGSDFAVAIRTKDGEPTDARCGKACDDVAEKIATVLEAYLP